MRMSTCDGCGERFAIRPNHPAWEIDRWCPACFRTLMNVVLLEWDARDLVPAMRTEDV